VQDALVSERAAQSLEELYRTTGPKLWRALLLYTGDPHIAEDAVSETFTRALAEGPSVRDPEAWIWRVGFRVAARELRTAKRADSSEPLPYRLPEETVELVVVLHYFADMPLEEIARRIGSTRAAVGVHLHRARARLRTQLGDGDDG
jgi:RNA polymerase sigma-70 factor (ECF subfamily)